MISSIISRLVILVFGTLYPAYASYKAVRTKNLKEYVKWMMYWIVFALFTCTETFTDVFLSWFPFYYEVKIVLVLWLLSPATKGSSILYRKFVHPALCRREQEIDEYIAKAKDQGYHTVLNLGTKGVNYATTVIMQTAIKGGGGLVQQLRKSYSLSDLSECEPRDQSHDEADDVLTEPRLIRRGTPKSGYNTRRSASESNSRSPMYFPEVDVDLRSNRTRSGEPDFSHIKSSEDISSGYSSADNSSSLTRAGSIGARAKSRTTRTTVTTIKRPQAAEDNEVIIEELHDDEFDYTNMPALVNVPSQLFVSNSDPPFIYQYVGDQIKIIQVLGNIPFKDTINNQTNNADQWDQKDATFEDASPMMGVDKETANTKEQIDSNNTKNEKNEIIDIKPEEHAEIVQDEQKQSFDTVQNTIPDNVECTKTEVTDINYNKETIELTDVKANVKAATPSDEKIVEIPKTVASSVNVDDQRVESTSIDTSLNDNSSAESDDEASFGTPEDSPKNKRKSPKGKYGKGKAPPPPPPPCKPELGDLNNNKEPEKPIDAISTTSQESLTDIVNKLPNTPFKETGSSKTLHVNPIAEKKNRHKSKSPARLQKASSSGIGKLLQLPSKLAFWHKGDEKSKDHSATSSRRSSANEKLMEEFQISSDVNINASTDTGMKLKHDSMENLSFKDIEFEKYDVAEDQISFKDASDFESESISQEIIDKSDALQRLIEAKLESHPEYKIVSLHEDIPNISKSTDV